jgi:hypothetical protein
MAQQNDRQNAGNASGKPNSPQNGQPTGQPGDLPLYTTVDDELYAELSQLAGQKVVLVEVWEDSLSTALEGEEIAPQEQISFDIDLYLADGAYFELYSATCFDDPDSEPWQGLAAVSERLAAVARQGATLQEVAVDEEDQLVLVLGYSAGRQLYLPVAAWLLEEWDELPSN